MLLAGNQHFIYLFAFIIWASVVVVCHLFFHTTTAAAGRRRAIRPLHRCCRPYFRRHSLHHPLVFIWDSVSSSSSSLLLIQLSADSVTSTGSQVIGSSIIPPRHRQAPGPGTIVRHPPLHYHHLHSTALLEYLFYLTMPSHRQATTLLLATTGSAAAAFRHIAKHCSCSIICHQFIFFFLLFFNQFFFFFFPADHHPVHLSAQDQLYLSGICNLAANWSITTTIQWTSDIAFTTLQNCWVISILLYPYSQQ